MLLGLGSRLVEGRLDGYKAAPQPLAGQRAKGWQGMVLGSSSAQQLTAIAQTQWDYCYCSCYMD